MNKMFSPTDPLVVLPVLYLIITLIVCVWRNYADWKEGSYNGCPSFKLRVKGRIGYWLAGVLSFVIVGTCVAFLGQINYAVTTAIAYLGFYSIFLYMFGVCIMVYLLVGMTFPMLASASESYEV